MLDVPFQTALDALALARDVKAAVLSAPTSGCSGPPACDLTPGAERDRLVTLVGAARMDLEAALLAISGRVPGTAASDPTIRARLALGLVTDTPGELRSFLARLAHGTWSTPRSRVRAGRRAGACCRGRGSSRVSSDASSFATAASCPRRRRGGG